MGHPPGSSNSSQSSNSSSPGVSPNDGGGWDPWGSLYAQGGNYVPGTVDWDGGNPPSETLEEDNLSCDCINSSMREYSQQVNNANIAYNPFSTNSNAFAFGAASAGGFVPAKPPVWAPGNTTTVPQEVLVKHIAYILALSLMCACSRKDNFACVDGVKNKVAIGTSIEGAKAALGSCQVDYSIDPTSRTLHGIVRGKSGAIVRENRTVTIKFDAAGKVSSVEVRKESTGL